jgi:hypothetical protein
MSFRSQATYMMKRPPIAAVTATAGSARPRWGFPLLCLLAVGCTYQTQPLSTQPGTLTLNVPGSFPTVVSGQPSPPTPPVGIVTPERNPGLEMAAASPFPRQGRYAGTAVLIKNPGGHCRRTLPIRNWVVSGDRVSYRGFRGHVRPDGSVVMQAGPGYIKGRFAEARFEGRFWQPGRACTYALTLEAVE